MADIPKRGSLNDLLAEQLPKDVPFTFYHYSTPPTKSPALFSAPPHAKSERTYCESHFLSATITPKDAGDSHLPEELLILAIEVLVYSTRSLTTLFVSKADSTGYLSELQLPRSQSSSPLKAICGTFVSWLARERQREGKKLFISLFARAQDQYLFPASIDNKNKRIICRYIKAAQFALAPVPATPDQVTLLEEDKIQAFYAAGSLYAWPGREGPLL